MRQGDNSAIPAARGPPKRQIQAIRQHHQRKEGDLIIGLQRSAIGTMAERKSRLTSLVHLPREPGHGTVARTKNGPALAGYGAQSMNRALVAKAAALPPGSLRSLTWDRGKELSGHAAFTEQTGVGVYFAEPHSPWQRPLNENTVILGEARRAVARAGWALAA